MLILYVALKDDYGRPEQGRSFEHYNFYETLRHMGHDILYFDFMGLLKRRGRDGMNRRLFEVVNAERPALMFTVLFRDELEPSVVQRISRETDTTTLNWFCDDQWRFDDLSRHWAPCFNWVVTTCGGAVPKYARLGLRNVIKSQWACNHFLYRRVDMPLAYDVTFVGQPHGERAAIIRALRDVGLRVQVWGQGWESGRLSQERMIEVFNQSRINLNLANTSSPPSTRAGRLLRRSRQGVAIALGHLPGGAGIKMLGRRVLAAAAKTRRGAGPVPSGVSPREAARPGQIKGRNFEVPGCAGFLLSETVEDLEHYYEPGREVALFRSPADLVRQAEYYLRHEEERAAIARAGYERTVREHTYVHRFCDIFRTLGFPTPPPAEMLAGQAGVGRTVEVG
jgi:spore maturation protein CgeB